METLAPFLPGTPPFIDVLACDAIINAKDVVKIMSYMAQWMKPRAALILTIKLRFFNTAKEARVRSTVCCCCCVCVCVCVCVCDCC